MVIFLSNKSKKSNTRFESIFPQVKERLKKGLDEASQYELAKIINLLPYITKDENPNENFLELVDLAISSLLSNKPKTKFANEIRINLQNHIFDKVDKKRPWYSPWRFIRNPGARVFTGLAVIFFCSIPIAWFFYKLYLNDPGATIFGIYAYKIALVFIMGMFGSIVSIMLRIRDFSDLRGEYASTLYFTGFTKPLIGGLFSLFVLTLISSEILPLNYSLIEGKAFHFFSAISFVTGFSERFARDLISRTEEVFL